MLIGCKTDLRKDRELLRKLRAAELEPITYLQVSWGPLPSPNPSPGARVFGHSHGWKDSQAFGFSNCGALMAFRTAEAKRLLRIIILKYC